MTVMTATDIGALERMADRVRAGDPSLDAHWLEPDGRFQTRGVALDVLTREMTECLARGFRGRAEDDFPTVFCAWGKCRVGSTALTNLFGVAGLPSYYQPVKTIARHRLTGGEGDPWNVPAPQTHPHLFCKEMAGPYVLAECLYIPLQPLIEAGYPASKLHLIVLDRDPARSLASWLNKWPHRVPEDRLVANYVIAALNAMRVTAYARRQGIATTCYVYEASKEAVPSMAALFDRLGLGHRFTPEVVTDWKEMGQLESESARVIYPREPEVYHMTGLHSSDTAYRYRERSAGTLNPAQLDVLARCGVSDVYRRNVATCIGDLGLNRAAAARLFGQAADALGSAA